MNVHQLRKKPPEQDIGPVLLPHEMVGIVVDNVVVPLEDWLEDECDISYQKGYRSAVGQYNALLIFAGIVLVQVFVIIAAYWVRPLIFIGP